MTSNDERTETVIASARRKWLALALLCTVQFMVVLDIAIVNVALPSIQKDLGFSEGNLQWVISAYALLFGGVLPDLLSWPWIFFVNVPVGVAAFAITPLLIRESRDSSARSFDFPGATLVTSGLVVLVYAITQGHGYGWASAKTIGLFAA